MKRHAVVDTLGLVWGLAVTPAKVADCGVCGERGRMSRLWADSAYRGLVAFCWVLFDLTVEVRCGPLRSVTFGEDATRTRNRNATANLRVVRRVVPSQYRDLKLKGG